MKLIPLLKEVKDRGIRLWVTAEGGLGFQAPKGALTRELAAALKANKPAILEVLASKATKTQSQTHAPANERPRLSFAQRRLYFIEQLNPGSLVYHMPGAVSLHGPLHVDALEKAFLHLIDRHEVLRTSFHENNGHPYPIITDQPYWQLQRKALQADTTAEGLAKAFLSQPFDLSHGPLLRAQLITCCEQEHVLVWDMHHIISDDWSMQRFFAELAQTYTALVNHKTPDLPVLTHQYTDYAWFESQDETASQGLDWWRQYLAGMSELHLPTDGKRPAQESHRGETQPLHLDQQLARAVTQLSQGCDASPFMIYLATFALVFQRLAGQDDVVLGTSFANRSQPEFESVLGFFINSLPLRLNLRAETVDGLIADIAESCLQAFAHGAVPFDKIVEALAVERDRSRHPLFQILMTYTNAPKAELAMADVRIEAIDWGDQHTARMDMTITLDDRGDGVHGHIEYNSDLFERRTIAALIDRMQRVLRQITATTPVQLSHLEMLSPEERRHIQAVAWSPDLTATPRDLPSAFRAICQNIPDREAILSHKDRYSYADCWHHSQAIAAALLKSGVKSGDRVAIALPREANLPLAILATLLSGAAYVPLDPLWPEARITAVLRDADPKIVLVDPQTATLAMGDIPTLDISGVDVAKTVAFPKPEIHPQSLAYIIFTSGSTGRPKGVAVSHASLAAFIAWGRQTFSDVELRGVFAATAATFDVSICELLLPFACGGTLIMGENALDLINHPLRERVRMIHTVPAAMRRLVAEKAIPPNVLRINLAGEALPATLLKEILEQTHLHTVTNAYGPTEDTVYATMAVLDHARDDNPEIGHSIAGKDAWIVDRTMQLQPANVPGELLLGGHGLAWGYWHQPALTAQSFVPHPFAKQPGARLYRSGDLARRDHQDRLHFMGRLDHQVKLNGYRIELGDVNHHLRTLPGVIQAESIVRDLHGIQRLLAFVCLEDSATEPCLIDSLQKPLADKLPAYMIPELIMSLPALPLNTNGKIDKTALQDFPLPQQQAQTFRAPETATQQQLASIWAMLPNVEIAAIGLDTHFFHIGGHSLVAAKIAARIRNTFQIEVPLKLFFDHPVLQDMATWIDEAPKRMEPTHIAHPSAANQTQLTPAQRRLYFIQRLQPDSLVYHVPGGLRLRGSLSDVALEKAFQYVIARHQVLRMAFKEDEGTPYPVIHETVTWKLERETTSDDSHTRARVDAFLSRPFELTKAPLLRALLIQCAADDHILIWDTHHIITDDWSMQIFFEELSLAYNAYLADVEPALPPLTHQYSDYAAWQAGLHLDQDLHWWRENLTGITPLHLPSDAPRPAVERHRGKQHPIRFDGALRQAIATLAKTHNITPFMVHLAAFGLVFQRLSGQDDMVLGTTFGNRDQPEFERVMGLFINSLALRLDMSSSTLADLLQGVQETCLQAFEHGQVPFEQIVQSLDVARDRSRHPIFQVLFSYTSASKAELHMGDLTCEPLGWGSNRVARMDMTIQLDDRGDGVHGFIEYNTDLYQSQTIARLIQRVEHILRQITAPNLEQICKLQFLLDDEQAAITNHAWASPLAHEPRPLHDAFKNTALSDPQRVAIFTQQSTVSYGKGLEQVHNLAAHFQDIGIQPGDLVGICLSREAHLPLAMIAALMVGATYIPLDPKWPQNRLAMVLEDAPPRLVLTDTTTQNALQDHRVTCISIENIQEKQTFKPRDIPALSPAYILFTSGSTGRPKGVAVSRAAIAAFVTWGSEAFSPEELGGVFAGTSATFDVSVCELLLPLGNGGTLIMAENALSLMNHPQRDRVRMFNTVPSAMVELVAEQAIPSNVLRVNLAGEALPGSLLRDILATTPLKKVVNLYGPTEDTVYATMAQLDAYAGRDPELGKPLAGKDVWVLNQRMALQPLDAPGELHLGGHGLALGYWGNPALTAQKFVPHPFAKTPGARLYKSGDLVRLDSLGALHFMGRIDHQVKLNGFRIELGEVNFHLRGLKQVREAEALVCELGGQQRLIGFVALHEDGNHEPRILDGFSHELRDQLPAYMVPQLILALPKLPLNANGKVDKKALQQIPIPQKMPRQELKAPVTPTQKVLADIWASMPGVNREDIGRESNFFEIGGHSLLAGKIAARIKTRLRVDMPLQHFFNIPVLEDMAEWLDQVGADPSPLKTEVIANQPKPLAVAPSAGERPAVLPLSFSQLRLWLVEQMGDLQDAYHIPLSMELTGPLNLDHLSTSLRELVARHEALRTIFPVVDDAPVQSIQPPPAKVLEVFHIHKPPIPGQEPWRDTFLEPFELDQGPLYRFRLYRLAPQRHILAICLHHLIADGWSLNLLFRDMLDGYHAAANGEITNKPAFLQYPDFAIWQRKTYSQSRMQDDLNWWMAYLQDLPEVLHLPSDHPGASGASAHGQSLDFSLDIDLAKALTNLARQQNTTLYVVLLSAYNLLLHRFSGMTDLAVGTPIAGRRHENLEQTIGCFINNLVIRSQPTHPQQPYLTYLQNLRDKVLESFEHQDLPFEKLVEHLVGMRNPHTAPLFQVMFNLMEDEPLDHDLGDLSIRALAPPKDRAQYELTLTVVVSEGRIAGSLEYNADRFLPETASFLLRQWQHVLAAVVADPQKPIDTFSQVPTQKHTYQAEAFDRRLEMAKPSSIWQALRSFTQIRPNHPALLDGKRSLSYAQLAAAAHQLSQQLQAQGIGCGDRVGIFLGQDANLVIAILALRRLGATHVALDPKFPEQRLRFMLEDSGCQWLLCQEIQPWFPQELKVVTPDWTSSQVEPNWDVEIPPEEALAYIVYTSGTTGVPKGIAIPNRAFWNMASATAQAYRLHSQDRVLQFAALGFDVFLEEAFATLVAGATLVMRPQTGFATVHAFNQFITNQYLSVVNLPVAWWAEWLHALEEGDVALPACLTTTIVGSEAVPRDKLDRWRRIAPDVAFFNAYGPSETCVTATIWHDHAGRGRSAAMSAPIGVPIAGLSASVRDPQGELCSYGFIGELHLGGAGLARGYLGRPALTAQHFVPDPNGHGTRLYRTGDLVRHLPSEAVAALEFIGRRDTQVKLRGFRIELQEIASNLRHHPYVDEVRVTTIKENDHLQLVAYLVNDQNKPRPTDPADFAQVLANLPSYMHPQQFVWLDQLPQGTTGKVDESQLPAVAPTKTLSTPIEPVMTPLLDDVLALWQDVLARPIPSADANFFELGGQSLNAVRLIGRFNRAHHAKLSLGDFMAMATPRLMAQFLASSEQRSETPVSVNLRPATGPVTHRLVLLHAATGQVWPYQAFAKACPADLDILAIQAQDSHGLTIHELAHRYIQKAELADIAEAITLVGWSLGGLIAWEIAAQLAEQGKKHQLILLDTYPLNQGSMQSPMMRLAAFATDLGLGRQQQKQWAASIPEAWTGEDITELKAIVDHPPSPLSGWQPQQIQALWRNHQAHLDAARTYLPPRDIKPRLLQASQPGDLPPAARCWQQAGYELDVQAVAGNHYELLQPPFVGRLAEQIADLIRQSKTETDQQPILRENAKV